MTLAFLFAATAVLDGLVTTAIVWTVSGGRLPVWATIAVGLLLSIVWMVACFSWWAYPSALKVLLATLLMIAAGGVAMVAVRSRRRFTTRSSGSSS